MFSRLTHLVLRVEDESGRTVTDCYGVEFEREDFPSLEQRHFLRSDSWSAAGGWRRL